MRQPSRQSFASKIGDGCGFWLIVADCIQTVPFSTRLSSVHTPPNIYRVPGHLLFTPGRCPCQMIFQRNVKNEHNKLTSPRFGWRIVSSIQATLLRHGYTSRGDKNVSIPYTSYRELALVTAHIQARRIKNLEAPTKNFTL